MPPNSQQLRGDQAVAAYQSAMEEQVCVLAHLSGATTHDSLGAAPKDDSFLAFEAALGHIEGVGGQEVVPAAGLTWRDACC